MIPVKKGTTGYIAEVFIQDTSAVTGVGLGGLVFNSGGLSAYYHRNLDGADVSISLQTMTVGTWATGGFKEVDASNMKGVYQIGIPNAALVTGADSVTVYLFGAANMAPVPIRIILTGMDFSDAVRGGLTAMPNANAEAAGGLFTRGTGPGQINQAANGQIDASLKALLGTSVTEGSAGRLAAALTKLLDVDSPTLTAAGVDQTGDSFARIGATGSGLSSLATAANLALAKTAIDAIKAVTDLLPNAGALSSLAQDSTVAKASALTTAKTAIDAIKTVTDLLPNAGALSSLATAVALATAQTAITAIKAKTDANLDAPISAILTTAMAEAYAADGAAPTPAQMLFMLWSMLGEKSIAGVTLTAKKLDGTTAAMTFTLNDATDPTSITRAS